MPETDVWTEINQTVTEAIVNTAGTPFPERLEEIGMELGIDVVAWVYDNLSEEGTPPEPTLDPVISAPMPDPPPDPADGGLPPGGGVGTSSNGDEGGDGGDGSDDGGDGGDGGGGSGGDGGDGGDE
jgi:hypothetical protein